MKAVKLVIRPSVTWHVPIPTTFRVERSYPFIPPTILFGIVQNLLNTSARSTPYREDKILSLGGFPDTDVTFSLELERIVQLKEKDSIPDKHVVEIVHSGPISCYLLVEDSLPELIARTVGDIVHLTSAHFPAIVASAEEVPFRVSRSRDLTFSTARKGLGLPYVVPLRYEFPRKEDYSAQKYGRVLLPFAPSSASDHLRRDAVRLGRMVSTIEVGEAHFDSVFKDLCRNRWDDSIPMVSGVS